ncbi:MAG: hypothetical protein FK732_05790, partial [Asgard group archaeon]|nr:hypothetical protein [Asgard group archaeon]
MAKYTSTLFKNSKNLNKILVLISILILTIILSLNNFNLTNVEAHNPEAYPIEIFSLWNNTTPTIDGTIGFTPSSLAGEWSSAAVYDIYDFKGDPDGKLLLQNDNTHLYVGMDAISYNTPDPVGGWGSTLYLDAEHYGVLNPNVFAVAFKRNTTGYHVEIKQSTGQPDEWVVVDYGTVGVPLPITGILVNIGYGKSAFNNLTAHRQFEFMIPYASSGLTGGDMFGVGFEIYDGLIAIGKINTWPYVGLNPKIIRTGPQYWGDLLLGEQFSYEKYVIEDNFNIKDGAVGAYNGTYLTLANITSDASLELVAMSNRTVTGDTNLISIFDYVDGKIKRIWGSWESAHYSSLFHIIGIAAYDFDGDGSDELYGVSHKDSRIGRLFGWNDVTGDFDSSEIIFDNYGDFMLGYIVIDDVLNEMDGTKQIAFGDEIGWLGFLTYNDKKDEFDLDHYIDPGTNRIHALEVADTDADGWNELLYFNQYSTDNSMSETNLSIIEYWYFVSPPGSWYDNAEDNLPLESVSITQDQWGHTIIVDDMDNDGWDETIIVGKDYVKIFTPDSFDQPSPPIEFMINDGVIPDGGGGGAGVIDIDGDSYNELIVGCTNGTTIIYQFEDSTFGQEYIPTTFTEEWRADLGLAPGTKNSIVGLDIDEDGIDEAIIGDQFGQIIVLGLGPDPVVTITFPTYGYVTNQDNILLKWQPSNETLPIHHYDIYVNNVLVGRAGGGQTQHLIALELGSNVVIINGTDVTGSFFEVDTYIIYTQGAPEVTIWDPPTGFATNLDNVMVQWNATDPDGDDIDFHIYVNGTFQKTVTSLSTNVELKIGGIPYDGWYNITIVADDGNGNFGKDTVWVARDTTAPSLVITSPSDGIAVNVDSIELSWFSWDELAGVYNFEVLRDGMSQGFTTDQFFDVNLTSDKSYTLSVIAYDHVGNNHMESITITRDTIDPYVELLPLALPSQDGWYYTDDPTQTVQWDGYDNAGGSGVLVYEIEINDVSYGFYGWDINETLVDLGEEGFKEVLITVYDEAGNYAFDYYTVAVDSSDPTISISAPYDNYTTSDDSVVVTWDSSDLGTGLKEHIIYVNGSLIDTVPFNQFYYTLDLTENSTHFITIRAVDYLDRFSEETINVTQDAQAATFFIINPIDFNSYSSSTIKNVQWDVINIVADQFHVYVNDTLYGTYDSSTFNATIDFESVFGPIPASQYPVANVTIAVLIGASYQFIETRWITIDQTDPSIAILEPTPMEIILDDSLFVEWSAFDSGSGINEYNIWLNGDYIGSFGSGITSQYIDVSSYIDGLHTLIVEASDLAGNAVNVSVDIELYPQAPEFNVDVPSLMITNDPNYLINLNVFDPRLGVSEIQIVADASIEVFSLNYNGTYQYDPFSLEINVTEDVFVAPGDLHNMTITVYDLADRGRTMVLDIIVDVVDPDRYGNIIFGGIVLAPDSNTVDLTETPEENIHNITFTARDTYGVSAVYLNVTGDTYDEMFDMIFDPDASFGDLYVFTFSLNLNDFADGNYTLIFIVHDNAGNSMQESYLLTVQTQQGSSSPNWFMEHLYDIILPSAGGLLLLILLPTILSVATRKRRANRGWKEALEAVAYVTKTGLTLAYVPYSRDLFEDEQLFGGALTGVVGILGEITGETEIQMQVHVLEFGDKRLMVCAGIFGNAILLVNDVKPILDDHVKKFLMEFELTYKLQLSQELIDL